MSQLIKLNNADFETNLKYEDIMKIVDKYMKENYAGEAYEMEETILYDVESDVTHEPVWYVEVILCKVKERFLDAYDCLAISDREGRLVYVQNDHGSVVEKF